MGPEFASAVERARKIERAVARAIMARGVLVLAAYDFSGLSDNKAPKLEAFSSLESLVVPDLFVARQGRSSWVEVKWKGGAFLFRKTRELETGINLRLWDQYQQVRSATGARVFLVFVHERERLTTCDEIEQLREIGPRCSKASPSMPAMANWPLRLLTPFLPYDEIVPAEAA